MTKLIQWMSALFVLFILWAAVLFGDAFPLDPETRFHVWLSPVYTVIACGLSALIVVLYRTATFNDCPEAAAELKKQIEEARHDLRRKGFKF